MTMTEVNRKKPNTKNCFWTHLCSSANIPLTSRICSCILASIHLCSWLNKFFIFFQSAAATLTETWSLVVASFRTLSKCSLIVSTLPRMSVTVKPSFLSHRWYCWIADSSWRERTSSCPASSFFVTFEIIFLNIPAGQWPVPCPVQMILLPSVSDQHSVKIQIQYFLHIKCKKVRILSITVKNHM